MPSFGEEKILESQGYRYVAGVDEAGRGALAGPVVAAAVILPANQELSFISQVRDSKKLSPQKRPRSCLLLALVARLFPKPELRPRPPLGTSG